MSRASFRSVLVRVALVVGLVGVALPVLGDATAGALPNTTTPSLTLNRTIRTTPFTGTSSSMRDGEGSAFVPNDPAHPNIDGTDSLWLAEDNGRAAWEINPYTGALKSSIRDATWQATKQYSSSSGTGTGASAGANRDPDIESMAYDTTNDTLYVFSGKCCQTGVLPTSYRLKRAADHTFHPEAWQALPAGSDYTASAWQPQDHKVYVGVGSDIRTYDFATNVSGSTFKVSGVSGIYGMSFSDDGNDLFVARSSVKLLRVNWNTKTLMSGWSIDLTPFGMKDSRAVELINDQFYVLDGYDGRQTNDPLRYAVFVFDVCCGSVTSPPVASFSSAQAASPDYTIQFTDTSTNSPTGWTWDFDNNGTVDSTAKNPSFTFSGSGDFAVKHTASNSGGNSLPVTQTVHVNPPPPPAPPVANFSSASATSPPFTVNFTDSSTGAPTSWAWDFDNDTVTDSTAANPSYTFAGAATYPVTLTVTNGSGTNSITKNVVVSAVASTITLDPTADSYVSKSSATKNYAAYTDLKMLGFNGTYEYHPYFQFNVSGLSGTPTSAKLRLFVTDGGTSGGNWFSPTGSWTEATLNWNNAPALTGSPFTTVGAVPIGQWVDIDVTAKVTGNGIVTFASTNPTTDMVTFASRESANKPQLIITR
ncbi:MAG: DNRLRE domain-containing protein [Acidimicrobiia bacterium]